MIVFWWGIVMGKKVLFISGCTGLGHITRDLAIAKELRTFSPDLEISWLAEFPASAVLKEFKEDILPESEMFNFGTVPMEVVNKGFEANVIDMSLEWFKAWPKNVESFQKVIEKHHYDLVIGDEAYHIHQGIIDNPGLKTAPFVALYDFVGHEAVTANTMEHGAEYQINQLWMKLLTAPNNLDRILFIGDFDDIHDIPFGFDLPNKRQIAKDHMDFIGYVVPDDIDKYSNKSTAKKLLGYGTEPLVICSIGGTNIGVPILNLCIKSYGMMKKEIPDLKMLLVGGPRVPPQSIEAPNDIEVVGYLPQLYRHMGASDLNVIVCGGTTSIELMALNRPFIYFPIAMHFEQIYNAERCQRYNAGIGMDYKGTTPELLAKMMLENINRRVSYRPIPSDGAKRAAYACYEFLAK
jgi:UDP-N-acetylglucosamine:LPS N-acetylglucosamine transferase